MMFETISISDIGHDNDLTMPPCHSGLTFSNDGKSAFYAECLWQVKTIFMLSGGWCAVTSREYYLKFDFLKWSFFAKIVNG